MDVGDGGMRHAVLPVPLALLHHLPHGVQGDGQREMDGAGRRPAHGAGAGAVPGGDGGGGAAGSGMRARDAK